MGLFKNFRAKKRPEKPIRSISYPVGSRVGPSAAQKLPDGVLEIIFSYVCPHAQDLSYESSEDAPIKDGCMLCDMRDLANCTRVCKRWKQQAQILLYTSIRIDAVHYCALEDELHQKRKKAAKHTRGKPRIEPGEIPGIRLELLCRTLRDSAELAQYTQFLKLPYMMRQACRGTIACTVSATPNLRYVDLPEGFFSGDLGCLALRAELQAQCPLIGKMSYRRGAEQYLNWLIDRGWQHIQVLELSHVAVDAATLQLVLSSLPALLELTLCAIPMLDDSVFVPTSAYAAFSPVQSLKLDSTLNITANGLRTYLEHASVQETLKSLTLQDTGVVITELGIVLWGATSLKHLSYIETAHKSVASKDLHALSSTSLEIMNFEIVDVEGNRGLQHPSDSYYAYLADSLRAKVLPALTTLYVRERSFMERLLTPCTTLRADNTNPFMQNHFNQKLEVFAKGIDELEWRITAVAPPDRSQHRLSMLSAGGRPLSAYSATRGLGPQWAQGGFGGEVRKSVIVSNGLGGYLAVPASEVPNSHRDDDAGAGADDPYLKPPPSLGILTGSPKLNVKRSSRNDLWR